MKRPNPSTHHVTDPSLTLRETAAQLEQAETFRQKRNFDRAESICAGLLRHHPTYFAALYTLGLILADKKDYGRALLYLMRALIENPRSVMALNALSGVLIELNAKGLASRILEIALDISPNDPIFLTTLGELHREQREYEQAISSFGKALALDSGLSEASLGLALSLQSTGRVDEAARILEDCINKRQSTIDMLFALAQLPKSVVTIDFLEAANTQAKHDFEDREVFENISQFIKAIALDRLGRYEEAWNYMLSANRKCKIEVSGEYQLLIRRQQETRKWIEKRQKRTQPLHADNCAISLFILGPSRSGKTSLEAAISGWAGVTRGYESEIVERATRSAFQSAGLIDTFPLVHLPQACYPAFRDAYLSDLLVPPSATHIYTNTNPSNIHNVSALIAIVPNVRVVFINRNLDDIALRIFMYRYKSGNEYAYDLKSIYEHVRWYYEIMEKIAEQNPAIVKIVKYEELVADPHKVVRSIAELCSVETSQELNLSIGDDRGCSAPYRDWMLKELN